MRSSLRIALAALVLTAPSALAHEINTSRKSARPLPLPRGDDVFHFAIFGDRTGGPAEGIRVLERAVRDTNLLESRPTPPENDSR